MDFTDVASLRIKILGDEAKKDLQSLKNAATDIKSELTLLENAGKKNTVVWRETKRLQKEINEEIKISTRNIDLQGASLNEMRAIKAQLNRELNNLAVGSEAWIAKLNEISPVNAKIKETENAVRGVGDEAVKQESTWSKFSGWIKGAFIVTGIYEVLNAIKSFTTGSLDEAKKFESAAQDLRGEVTLTDEQFKALKKSAIENGEAFGMTGEMMLKAYNAIASGKSDLIDVKGGIESVTDAAIMLATNGGMQLDESAKLMTSSLNQFGAGAKDAAKFVDILSTGTIVGAGKIEELAVSLRQVGPIAKAAGLSFAETNAALQILHQNGIKGEQAGTALRGVLSQLMKGAKDTNPSIVGLGVAMENLAKKQLTATEMVDLFGREAASSGIAISSNSAKLKEWTATIEKGGGAAEMYAEKTKTVEFAEKQAAAAYANSRKEIGEKLLPIWVGLVNFFTQYGIPSIQAVATSIIAVIQGLAAMPKFIAENKELFIGLGVALISLNGANIAAAASALYMAAAEKGRAVVTKASATAQWLLNAAMTANPIGAAIAALAVFTGAMVWAYKNVDWFRAAVQASWAGLKEYVKVILDVSKAILKLDFSAAWDRLKNGWSSVSKASGEAYEKAMAESTKRVAANTEKAVKQTGAAVVKTNKETAKAVADIDEEGTENAKKNNKEKAVDFEEHMTFLKNLAESTQEKIKKVDEDYTKWLFDEYEKRSKVIDSAVDKIQKNIERKELEAQKDSVERNKEALSHLAERLANFGKKEEERIEKTNKLNLDALEKEKQKTELFVNMGLDAYTILLEKATDYFGKMAESSESSSKRMNAAITNEFLKPMTANLNAAKAIMQGDFAGAAEGLIGYFKGLWDVTIGLRKTLKESAEIKFFTAFEADFAKLSQFNDKIKEVFGDLAGATAELQTVQNNSLEGRIAAEIKVGEKIKENYALAVEKENAYYETRRKAIEDAYTLEVQRINDKYSLLSTMASMQFGAESLAIQQRVNTDLMAFVTNEDTKASLTADYQAKKNAIISAYASQIKPITDGMSQAEIDGINNAIKARDEQLARVEGWLTSELQFIIGNEGQKRKEYSATELIIQKGKDDTELLSIKYAASELERQTQKNLELVAAENTKNAGLEAAAKTHNDTLVAMGEAKDAALIASFDRLRDAMLSGYAAMEAAASAALQKGLITAAQYEELINRANTLRNLVNEPIRSYNTNIVNDFVPGINQYASGTTYVDAENRYPDGTDTVPAYLTKGERVVPPDLNKLLGGMSNEQLVASLYKPSESLTNALSNSGLSKAGASMLMNGSMINYVSGSAVKSAAMGVTMSQSAKESAASGGEGMAKNNELMAALIELIAGQTNAELKKLNDKPNLTLHDVQNAASANNNLDRISNL